MLKFAVLLAVVAVANAGVAPAAYGHALSHGFAGPALAAPAAGFHGHLGGHLGAPVAYAAPVAKVAAPLAYAAPAVAKVAVAEEYDPHPQYSYSYSVADGLTGDTKGHQESRDGDVVQGSYSVADPDGTLRTVHYTADPINGFNAVIDRQAPAVAKVAAPVAVAKVAAPLAYAAPVAKFHAAPLAAAPLPYGKGFF